MLINSQSSHRLCKLSKLITAILSLFKCVGFFFLVISEILHLFKGASCNLEKIKNITNDMHGC